MITWHDAEHLVPNAGDPQPGPGDCTNLGERRWRWWHPEGYCHGCKSWQPVTFTPFGWRLARHEPAPPKYDTDVWGHPYPFPSYTQPPCDDCAANTDQASYDRGDSVSGIY